jgi:WD40 repeat protein
MTLNTSNLLKSISVSFEDDNTRHCAVELSLGASSPLPVGIPGNNNAERSNDGIDHEFVDSSPESRNDHEHSSAPSSATSAPSSIFRNIQASLDHRYIHLSSSGVPRNHFAPKSHASWPGIPKKEAPDGKATPAGSEKQTFSNSMSYDGIFEGLRQITSETEVLGTNNLADTSSCSSLLEQKAALLSRADEMILEARKACAEVSDAAISEMAPLNENIFGETKARCKEGQRHVIQRTQSLDRALSTKEVLQLATQALQEKEKSKRRITAKNAHSFSAFRGERTEIYVNALSCTTNEQMAMVDRQREKGNFSLSEDRRVRETLSHIKAKDELASPKRSSSPRNNSDASLLDDTEEAVQALPSFLPEVTESSRDQVLKRLDGIRDKDSSRATELQQPERLERVPADESKQTSNKRLPSAFSLMKFLWGGDDDDAGKGVTTVGPSLLACGPDTSKQLQEELEGHGLRSNKFSSMATALMERRHGLSSFAETISSLKVDTSRMQDWIDGQFAPREDLPEDGNYLLGKSRTVVVHEIVRGNWTWCTAWSPDGSRLAVATENHHLAIIDTNTSVWRVRHDQRITGPVRNDTTHSIRAIAWGSQFIAIAGTGNAVSILSPSPPYEILHVLKGTGFVGSLDWKINSSVLAIGSRLDKAMIVKISPLDDSRSGTGRQLQSDLLHTIMRKSWVNAVAFSPGGVFFCLGEGSGQLSVYRYGDMSMLASFTMEDSILAISFSPDGKYLYSGGEDFCLTCIDTNHWEIVQRLPQKRWVQCLQSSSGATHLAVGGVTSEVSILEVGLGWDTVINIELKGLVPLSASWHPKDQYLALTGQNHSILVVETTNARHVSGHFLRSISSILAVEFSPDGRTAVVGNRQGVITFFKLQGSAFVTAYEVVVTVGKTLCMKWSPNGKFIVIGSGDALIIVGKTQPSPSRPAHASGYSILNLMRGLGEINSVSIDFRSKYIAASGAQSRVFDASSNYRCVREFEISALELEANAWSLDGRWLAAIGQSKILTIYDTDSEDLGLWRAVFSLQCTHAGLAVSWGPLIVGGLVYLAFGGEDKCITIVEIRTHEGTWETVLRAPRDDTIHDLDWNQDGLLAAAIGNGTVSIMDLSYLQSGLAVNEMDYNRQRQALTCFTELRRNRGKNCMRAVRWVPALAGSRSLLAIGGSDGEVEIVDLTNRERCRGHRPSVDNNR